VVSAMNGFEHVEVVDPFPHVTGGRGRVVSATNNIVGADVVTVDVVVTTTFAALSRI